MARYIDAEKIEYFALSGYGLTNKQFAHKPQIDEIPTADVAPVVHAHWETINNDCGHYGFVKCTACGDEYGSLTYRYCPNCGAKMDGKESEK